MIKRMVRSFINLLKYKSLLKREKSLFWKRITEYHKGDSRNFEIKYSSYYHNFKWCKL